MFTIPFFPFCFCLEGEMLFRDISSYAKSVCLSVFPVKVLEEGLVLFMKLLFDWL